jgi:hypothetical protein
MVSEEELKKAVEDVVKYLWEDELKALAKSWPFWLHSEHVFESLVVLRNWLDGTNYEPCDYVEAEEEE